MSEPIYQYLIFSTNIILELKTKGNKKNKKRGFGGR